MQNVLTDSRLLELEQSREGKYEKSKRDRGMSCSYRKYAWSGHRGQALLPEVLAAALSKYGMVWNYLWVLVEPRADIGGDWLERSLW
jgi:hypothetical protein